MRKLKIALALTGLAALGACADGSKTILADKAPIAYVRFVNAVPDSGGQDWRFVDAVEGSPATFSLTFRAIYPGTSYQSVTPGARHLRIFQSATDLTFNDPLKASPALVSTVFFDTTLTLAEGTHYTIIAAGNLRAPRTAKIVLLTDNYTDPGASVAVRMVNLGTSAVDVYGSRSWWNDDTSVVAARRGTGLVRRVAVGDHGARCTDAACQRRRIHDASGADRCAGAGRCRR